MDMNVPSEYSKLTLDVNQNKRGRPKKTNIIEFSSEPKSLIISHFINISKEQITNTKSEPKNLMKNLKVDSSADRNTEDGFVNKVCSMRSNKKKERSQQLLTQKSGLFSCDYPGCLYSCKLSCNLIKHRRTHTLEKPYLCDQCTFRTKFVNSLKVHKRIHTAERPFACKLCKYQCNSSSNLKKHCLHRHPEIAKT